MNKGIDMNAITLDAEVRVDLPEGWQEISENVAVNMALKRLLDITGLRPAHYSARTTWRPEGFAVKFHWRHIPEGISYAEMEKILNDVILRNKGLEELNKEIIKKMQEYAEEKMSAEYVPLVTFDDETENDDENDDDINGWASASSRKLPLA
jgi:hypothetical protein